MKALNQLQTKTKSQVEKIECVDDMLELGGRLAQYVRPALTMYFEGELGVGKTTLIRGLINKLVPFAVVQSPTFSIMNSYQTQFDLELVHMDLYRIEEPQELLLIGADEIFDGNSVCLIEWPGRGGAVVPEPDICVTMEHVGPARVVTVELMD